MGASTRLSTGLRFLDQQIGGGLESGGLLALRSPPNSQVELLFKELSREHPLRYVSTLSPDESELREMLGSGSVNAVDVDVAYRSPADVLEDPSSVTDVVVENSYLVFDAVNELERASREEYLRFLNELKRRVRETESVAVLHCLDESTPRRVLTQKRADHVWELQLLVQSSEIKNRLLITKSRSNQTIDEPLPLEFTDRVRVDTSRSIA